MYVILTQYESGELKGLAFVNADTPTRAKEIAGVEASSDKWIVAPLDALIMLENAKAGFIEKTF